MNRNNRHDNRNHPQNREPQQRQNQYEEGFHRGHSHYRNEGDFGSQNSVRGYGNYGNMGSYGGAQGYGEQNSWAQSQRGYYGQPYGDQQYQQLNQRQYSDFNWRQNDTPYGDWRENAGYYRHSQEQQPQRSQNNWHQNQWENQSRNYNPEDFSRRGRSYGPGNTNNGGYMGSGYNRISEGEYGPMLGDEGSESAYSRLNGGYTHRGGIGNPGNTFNTITNSFWDEDADNDYGASFGDDIQYNPYEAPHRRQNQNRNRRNR